MLLYSGLEEIWVELASIPLGPDLAFGSNSLVEYWCSYTRRKQYL